MSKGVGSSTSGQNERLVLKIDERAIGTDTYACRAT